MKTIIFDGGTAICRKEPRLRDNPVEEYSVDSLSQYLNCDIELRPGTTLRHVWKYLEKDVEFFDKVFNEALGSFPLNAYIEQSHKPSSEKEDEDPDNSMKALECYWEADVDYWGADNPSVFSLYRSFDGTGRQKYPNAEGKEEVVEGRWAIEFTPINDLLDYPLVLDNTLEIVDKSNYSYKVIWKGKKEWTVYDMYYAILYEISFIGLPDDQQRAVADLDQRYAEAKDYIENGDFSKFKKLDDVIAEIEEEGEE